LLFLLPINTIQMNLRNLAKQAAGAAGKGVPSPSSMPVKTVGAILLAAGVGAAGVSSLFTVDPGHRAVMFSRLGGVKREVYAEGTHLRMPWFEYATVFDIKTKAKTIASPTGTKDLQTVNITLRVLYQPDITKLDKIYSDLGTNYDERVLPSIVNETLKSIVAQFNANQLITQREQVSLLIRRNLEERAGHFMIVVNDVSITHLTFGPEYTRAIEAKQVAQQEAERAKYVVKQALEDKKSTIIKAQGEAKSAELIGQAVQREPGYLELRQLDAAKDIAQMVARSNNRVYLDSDSLLLNILRKSGSGKNLDGARPASNA